MGTNPRRYCTIHFMDGQSMRFIFEALKPEGDPTVGMAVEDFLKTKNLIFELDNKLTIIPMNNVRSIEVFPAPSNLPQKVIKAKSLE